MVVYKMTEKTNNAEICAEISTKRMYILLLKAKEMILEDNPKYYFKKEILSLLSTVEHEILMLNDENNNICRDLFK
jgi:hypothetical protein